MSVHIREQLMPDTYHWGHLPTGHWHQWQSLSSQFHLQQQMSHTKINDVHTILICTLKTAASCQNEHDWLNWLVIRSWLRLWSHRPIRLNSTTQLASSMTTVNWALWSVNWAADLSCVRLGTSLKTRLNSTAQKNHKFSVSREVQTCSDFHDWQ